MCVLNYVNHINVTLELFVFSASEGYVKAR